jgi:hypothetical protein
MLPPKFYSFHLQHSDDANSNINSNNKATIARNAKMSTSGKYDAADCDKSHQKCRRTTPRTTTAKADHENGSDNVDDSDNDHETDHKYDSETRHEDDSEKDCENDDELLFERDRRLSPLLTD